jgi:hypothetical protein
MDAMPFAIAGAEIISQVFAGETDWRIHQVNLIRFSGAVRPGYYFFRSQIWKLYA